jgi:predicted MPP superfamily phosphohydrolase
MQGISTPARQASPRPGPASSLFSRRNFLIGAAVASGGLALYSNEISRHEIETTQRTFLIRHLPPAFDGFRIVQISDLHLDQYTEDYFLKEIIARVNALTPDLVLVTGDFCSRGPLPVKFGLPSAKRCAELLTGITCPQRFGILGNHDAAVGPRQIRTYLENNNTPVLVNQYVPIERHGQRFWLAGLDDCLSGHPDLDLAIPPARLLEDAPLILMAHEPDYVQNIAAHARGGEVDLVFSGHTHGGQVRLPGGKPLLLPPGGMHYPEGHYLVGPTQLYVNRGIGTVGVPFRLNCPPEITVATLRTALA